MQSSCSFRFVNKKLIMNLRDRVCETSEELISSELFVEVLERYVNKLRSKRVSLLKIFGKPVEEIGKDDINELVKVFCVLVKMPINAVTKLIENSECFARNPSLLLSFVDGLYNFWRQFERFIICDSTGDHLHKRPYRTFNSTIESLTHLVLQTYRSAGENISGQHPNIYRQVTAGAEVAVIALPREVKISGGSYQQLNAVPMIRQLLLYPPLLLNPPMNKRTGKFEKVEKNPLELLKINPSEWLCYPAKVGIQLILVYIHQNFFELGFSLCNLFELADDDFLNRPVDAVFLFGVPGNELDSMASIPTVFFDDHEKGLISAACPSKDEFGYFGYLKKMVLTLHNIKVMKNKKMPYHGAMINITTKGNRSKTILIIGDTGAGKSETIEALRIFGDSQIEEITIIADDMGSLDITSEGDVVGYGTEVGAFVRLDDLQAGYAFGQLDRSIIMNPNQTNARIILPVTTYDKIVAGFKVDTVLYANNYEQVDGEHPIIERLRTPQNALNVFRKGTAMSKGTTTSTGLVHTYFVNVFGPVQYCDLHDEIAKTYFEKFFENNIFVGQLRTRLGISNWERRGPEEAAKALLLQLAEA
ncbi:MAG: phosphoenolpyruvate carboxykinase [Candidatus Riflebacteria bacterium]|nr:phosphoenolpyruvate carboxykinase [Candidatus Riflebacteria bacterium]